MFIVELQWKRRRRRQDNNNDNNNSLATELTIFWVIKLKERDGGEEK